MPVLQLLITIFCTVVFLTLLFFVLGYVILPLLLVFGFIAGIRWLCTEIMSGRKQRWQMGVLLKELIKIMQNKSSQKL